VKQGIMPAGAVDSDAVFDAAAIKVQAILRGSKARKSVTEVEVRLRALALSIPKP
jgi:hypothetical protein